ncbi:hypothetical protein [Symbioplanes lichenis]|uniref:hypothetical protein n=1 Tax=Symbioplanes lichenis TaxID=1629072 RepID=UPI00273A3D9F|nr:hypothetical protein [Actinoplanes lichenis]
MTDFRTAAPVTPERVFDPDSTGRILLESAVRALHGRDCRDRVRMPRLSRRPALEPESRRDALAAEASADALPADAVDQLDAEGVAAWIVGRCPEPVYPAAVLGSPHGSAVHLAAALGAPWLPSGFTISVPYPSGAPEDARTACEHGAELSRRIIASNPGVTVRQVHDPVLTGPLCGTTLTLHVRWHRVPDAYRAFLGDRLAPGGRVLLLRDLRSWPTAEPVPGHTFQAGSPVTGWRPEDYTETNRGFLRLLTALGARRWTAPAHDLAVRYAEPAGDPGLENALRASGIPSHRVLYPRPAALSAFVADLYRSWLATTGAGTHCVVGSAGLLDPGAVLAAGAVPYWCESAARPAVEAAEAWLAGSLPFDTVSVLPQPPGVGCDAYAPAATWRSVAGFARTQARLDRLATSRYPLLPLPTSHVATALADAGGRPGPPPVRLTMDQVLGALRSSGRPLGLLVT